MKADSPLGITRSVNACFWVLIGAGLLPYTTTRNWFDVYILLTQLVLTFIVSGITLRRKVTLHTGYFSFIVLMTSLWAISLVGLVANYNSESFDLNSFLMLFS